ncbi:MAG: macro domain-containing protein [Isosphaeraceae bacterium]
MRVTVKIGDILDEPVDVLICSANVHLNLSGGVGGAILARGGQSVQDALHAHLRQAGVPWVAPGTVVQTDSGPLVVGHLLHAVAIDGFYGSSVPLVRETIIRALNLAAGLGARSVAIPALATGYGPLSIAEFAEALLGSLGRAYDPVADLRVVLHDQTALDDWPETELDQDVKRSLL